MNLVDLDKIIVIGGGSAGLISALMLKKTFVTKHIVVIKSKKLVDHICNNTHYVY